MSPQWQWPVDDAAVFFDNTVPGTHDHMIPTRYFVCRQRPSDAWFESESRDAKLLTQTCPFSSSTLSCHTAFNRRHTSSTRHYDIVGRDRMAWPAPSLQWSTQPEAQLLLAEQDWGRPDFTETTLVFDRQIRLSWLPTIELGNHWRVQQLLKMKSRLLCVDPPSTKTCLQAAGCSFLETFADLSNDYVIPYIMRLPNKQSFRDALLPPCWSRSRLRSHHSLLTSSIFHFHFRPVSSPANNKTAFITPLIKKPGAVPTDVHSYRLISNLPIALKLLKQFVARQVVVTSSETIFFLFVSLHIDPDFQPRPLFCACCQDTLEAIDEGDVAIVVFLTCQQRSTLSTIRYYYDAYISHTVLTALYFIGSIHISTVEDNRYFKSLIVRFSMVTCGIPQGLILGPIPFIMYTPDLMRALECHVLLPHLFTDDMQVYVRCSLSGMDDLAARVSACNFEWNFELDAVRSTTTKHIQDQINLVSYSEGSSSTSSYSH